MSCVWTPSRSPLSYSWSKIDLTTKKQILFIDVEQYEVPFTNNGSKLRDSSQSNQKIIDITDHDAKPLKCGLCLYSTRKRNNIKAHMRVHSGVKPFRCEKCGLQFTHKSKFRQHSNNCVLKDFVEYITINDECPSAVGKTVTHSTEKRTWVICQKPFKCGMCSYSTRKKNNLKAHTRTHSGVKPYRCGLCEFSTTHKTFLKKHENSHCPQDIQVISPPVLSDSTVSLRSYNNSLITKNCSKIVDQRQQQAMTENGKLNNNAISEKVYFNCASCAYSCIDYQRRHDRHTASHNSKPFKCTNSGCNYAGGSHRLLLAHIRRIHTNTNWFKCSKCSYQTRDKRWLDSHLLKHSEEKPFRCDICEYASRNPSSLIAHKKTVHSTDKPFKCKSCEKSFIREISLIEHTRRHTGEKPYKCDACPYAAATKNELNAHKLHKHSNEKPFACHFCSYTTVMKKILNRHISKSHS